MIDHLRSEKIVYSKSSGMSQMFVKRIRKPLKILCSSSLHLMHLTFDFFSWWKTNKWNIPYERVFVLITNIFFNLYCQFFFSSQKIIPHTLDQFTVTSQCLSNPLFQRGFWGRKVIGQVGEFIVLEIFHFIFFMFLMVLVRDIFKIVTLYIYNK